MDAAQPTRERKRAQERGRKSEKQSCRQGQVHGLVPVSWTQGRSAAPSLPPTPPPTRPLTSRPQPRLFQRPVPWSVPSLMSRYWRRWHSFIRVSYTHHIITPSERRMHFSLSLLSKYTNPDIMMVSRSLFLRKSTLVRCLIACTKSLHCFVIYPGNIKVLTSQVKIDHLLLCTECKLFRALIFFIICNKFVSSACMVYMNFTDMILTNQFIQVY